MENNNHAALMSLLIENDKDDAERIRFDNEKLMFLNNDLQRFGRARCFNLADAEQAIAALQNTTGDHQ